MSELNPEQLRELDAEIAEKWFGDKPDPAKSIPFSSEQYCHPRYSTDPAASMLLLKKVAIANAGMPRFEPSRDGTTWLVGFYSETLTAPTLEILVVLFARKLKEKE